MRTLQPATALLFLCVSATTASAGQIIAQTAGLSGTDHVIDFGANLYSNFTPITTEFPGVTFSHSRYYTTGSVNNMVGGFLTNDFSGAPDTFKVLFANPISDLSFAYHQIGTSQPSTFRVLLGGVLVDSFSNSSDQYQPNNYFGFTGLFFDELQLDFVADFNIDTLAYNDPATMGSPGCDGSQGNCPCFTVGLLDHGCPNSGSFNGAKLVASGNAGIGNDSFSLAVTNCPVNNPGLVLSGTTDLSPGVSTLNDSAGLLCVGGATVRGFVVFTDGSGNANLPDFNGAAYGQAPNVSAGALSTYQYWYRDPGTACAPNDTAASDFNFSNLWSVTWTL